MITFRGKIVYRAIYARAANQVLMLALVTSNFETSSPSSVDCMLLRHKFTLFLSWPILLRLPSQRIIAMFLILTTKEIVLNVKLIPITIILVRKNSILKFDIYIFP